MKRILIFVLILLLVCIYLINGELNAFSRTSYRQLSMRLPSYFSISDSQISKKSIAYSFAGSPEDILLLITDLQIQVIERQVLEDMLIYYGYSPKFSRCIDYKGNKCNVQIVHCYGTITVGMPVIVGSY